jgi:hypothetical protein
MFIVWFEPLEMYFAEALQFVNHHVRSSLLAVINMWKEACNGKNCMRVDLVGK